MNKSNRHIIQGIVECDLHLKCDKVHVLQGEVRVSPGTTIKIDPGTVIEVETTIPSGLYIEPGARLLAEGTHDQPIVFTSGSRSPDYGDWLGIIIEGYGEVDQPLNPLRIQDSRCCVSDSGILKYVRIEYAGIIFLGVRKCTVIDYVQVSYAPGASFTFKGGDVNAHHLISYKPREVGVKFVSGYTGHVQFLLHLQDHNASEGAAGLLFLQDDVELTDEVLQQPLPVTDLITHATVTHATIIGPGETNICYNQIGYGIVIADYELGEVHNSIVTGYTGGILAGGSEGLINFQHNIIAGSEVISVNVGLANFDIVNNFNALFLIPSVFEKWHQEYFIPSSDTTLTYGSTYSPEGMNDPSIRIVNHRGAFDCVDWTSGWAEFVPCWGTIPDLECSKSVTDESKSEVITTTTSCA